MRDVREKESERWGRERKREKERFKTEAIIIHKLILEVTCHQSYSINYTDQFLM